MDAADATFRAVQIALPPAIQYFGRAKEREAKIAQTQGELSQTKAALEVLVMKNCELKQSNAETEKKNQELSRSNANLEAFRNIILILLAVAVIAV